MDNELNLRLNLFAANKGQNEIARLQKEITSLGGLVDGLNTAISQSFSLAQNQSRGLNASLVPLMNLAKTTKKEKENSFIPIIPGQLIEKITTKSNAARQSISSLNSAISATASSLLGLSNPISFLDNVLSSKEGSIGKVSETVFKSIQKEIQVSLEEIGNLDTALKGVGRTFTDFISGDSKEGLLSALVGGVGGLGFFAQIPQLSAPLMIVKGLMGDTNAFMKDFSVNVLTASQNLSIIAANRLPKLIQLQERLRELPGPYSRMSEERASRRATLAERSQFASQRLLLGASRGLGVDDETRQRVFQVGTEETVSALLEPIGKNILMPMTRSMLGAATSAASTVMSGMLSAKMNDEKSYEQLNKMTSGKLEKQIQKFSFQVSERMSTVIDQGGSQALGKTIQDLFNYIPSSLSYGAISNATGVFSPLLKSALEIGASSSLDDLFYQGFKKIPVLGSLGGTLSNKLSVPRLFSGVTQWGLTGESTGLDAWGSKVLGGKSKPANTGVADDGGKLGQGVTKLSKQAISGGIDFAKNFASNINLDSIQQFFGDITPNFVKDFVQSYVGGILDKITPEFLKNIIAKSNFSGGSVLGALNMVGGTGIRAATKIYEAIKQRIPDEIEAIEARVFGAVFDRMKAFFNRKNWLNFARELQAMPFKFTASLSENAQMLAETLKTTFVKHLPDSLGKLVSQGVIPASSQLRDSLANAVGGASKRMKAVVGGAAERAKKYLAQSMIMDMIKKNDPSNLMGTALDTLMFKNLDKLILSALSPIFNKYKQQFPNLSQVIEAQISSIVQKGVSQITTGTALEGKGMEYLMNKLGGASSGLANTLRPKVGQLIEKVLASQYEIELDRVRAVITNRRSKQLNQQANEIDKQAAEAEKFARVKSLQMARKERLAKEEEQRNLTSLGLDGLIQQSTQAPAIPSTAPSDLAKTGSEMFDKIVTATIVDLMGGNADVLKNSLEAAIGLDGTQFGYDEIAKIQEKAAILRQRAIEMRKEAERITTTGASAYGSSGLTAAEEFKRIQKQRKDDEKRVKELEAQKAAVKKTPSYTPEEVARIERTTGVKPETISIEERAAKVAEYNQEILKIQARYQTLIQQTQAKANLLMQGEAISTDETYSKLYKEINNIFGGGLDEFLGQMGKSAVAGFFRGAVIGSIDGISNSIGKIDRVTSAISNSIKAIPDKFTQPLTATKKLFAGLATETTGLKMLKAFADSFEQFSGQLFMVTQQIAIFQSTFQGVTALAQNNPLMTMIRQADEFQQQLITLQSSIASTNQIKLDGQIIANPTESIKILEKPIQSAVEKLREGSLQLSGITSQELIDPFIIVSGQIGQLGMNLNQATDLTLSFASAVTSLKLPANQFAQEIRSIVTGQITSDSMVAKTLGITNQMVGRWRSQGKVFDELSKRLEVFRAGQSLTAKTLGGLQSNVAEVFQEAGRIAGGKLLGPLTENLQNFYDYIFGNKDAINQYLSGLMNIVLEIGKAFKEAGTAIFSSVVKIGAQLPEVALQTAADAAKVFSQAVVDATSTLAPFVSILAVAAQTTLSLSSPFLALAIQFKVFETAVKALFLSFGGIMQAMPIVGGLMTALSVRGLPMINVFANLYDKVGLGAAGFLVLGKNMKAIPGLSDAITKGLGAKFGPIAGILTGIIPLMSTIGIQAAGLAKVIPFMSAGLTGILKLGPSAITGVGTQLAALPIFSGNTKAVTGFFDEIAVAMQKFTGAGNMSVEVSKLFQSTVADIGSQFKMFVLQTAALGAGFLLVASAVDQLILKNQASMDVLKTTFGVLFDIPRIIIQEVIPGLMQIPAVLTSINVGIVALIPVLVALGALPALGYFVARLTLIDTAVKSLTTATQALIITGLAPMSAQIGMAGSALTMMAEKATASAAAQVAAQSAIRVAAGKTALDIAKAAEVAIQGNFRLNGTFLMTAKQATALGPALSGLSVALTGFAAGTGSAAAAWTAFVTALKLSLIPLASVVALIGGVFVAAMTVAAIRMNQLQKEMADWNEQTNTMLDTSAKIERVMIRNAKEQEKRSKYGIALTKEEYQKNKQIQELALKDVQAMQQQIADLNKSRDKSKLNKAEIDGQVQLLEQQIKRLQDRAQNIQISTKPLQELGGTLTQLAEKSALALEGITNAAGDPEIFKQAADTLIKITQQELELGAISEKVATERLSTLVNNTKLEVDLRVAAEQALQKVRESATQKRIEEEKKAQQQIQTLADQGKMSEAKAAQELATARLKEIEVQINAEKQAHEERMKMRRAELAYEWEKLNVQAEAKERTLKYDTATDSTEAKSDLQKQQAKIADVQKQLAAGAAQIEAIQGKGGAASAEEQNQLQLLKAQQKTLEGQMTSYTDLIKYLESTIARLDLKKEAPAKIQEIAESLKQTSDSIQELEARLAATSNKGQQAEIQSQIASAKERQSGLLAEQNKYQTASQEMSAEAKDNLQKDLTRLKSEQKAIEQSGNAALKEEQRKHGNKLAELEAERAKVEKEKRDREKQERLKDFDEQLKISEAQRATGLKDEQQAAIDAQKINEGKVREEMKQLENRKKKLEEEAKKAGKSLKEFDKEAAEEIETQEAEHQQKLTEIRKQAFQRRMSDLKEDLAERTAVIEASQEKGDIDNQQAAKQTLEATKKSAAAQLKLIDEQLKQLKSTDVEGREELLKQRAEVEKQLSQARKKETKDRIADIQQDSEERTAAIELSEKKGVDKQIIAQQTLAEKTKEINQELAVIQEAKKTARGEYLEELTAQEKKLQGKLIDAQREAMDQQLADLKEDEEEQQAILDKRESDGEDKSKLALEGLKGREKSLNSQLAIIRKAMTTASGEALEKLKAQEAKLLKEMNDARRQALEKQLADIKEDSEERITGIERQEAEGADKQKTIQATRLEREKEINARLKTIRQALLTATGENYERLKAEENKGIKELHDMRRQMLEQQLADLKEDSEERMATIETMESEGVDKQVIAQKTLEEKTKEINAALLLIRKEMLTATSENLERLKAQEQRKIKELNDARKQALEQQLADIKEDSEERLATIEANESLGMDRQLTIQAARAEKEKELNQRLKIIRQALKTATGEHYERLLAQEKKAVKELQEVRRQAMEQQLADIKEDSEERLASIELDESSGLDKQVAIQNIRAEKEQEVMQRLAVIRQEMVTATGENYERLAAQEKKGLKELNDIRRQAFDQQLADIKEDSEERMALIELLESQGTDKGGTINKRLTEQERQIADSLKLVRKEMMSATGENFERLKAQENRLMKDLNEARKQANEQRLSDLKEDSEEQNTILESQFIAGLTTEEEYYKKRLANTLKFLDAQLELIKVAQSQLGKGQTEEQERLAVQESQIMKAREATLSEYQDSQLSILEGQQRETSQIIELSEIERQKQTQRAINDGLMTQSEADAARLENTRERITSELALEQQKLAFLQSQPAFSDPRKEEERQSKIRESQKKTSQLQLQLLEQERQAQEMLFKLISEAIDKRVAKLQNLATATQQRLDLEIKKQDYLTKSLDNQNRILQARQGLQGALSQFIDSEFKILEASATTEKERNRIAKLQANYKLQALYTEQQTQRQMLEIDIKRNEIAQKRAETENKIAQVRAAAEVAKAQAEVAKINADPLAKAEQKEAARLAVEAAMMGLAGTVAEGQSLQQQRQITEQENAMKRQTLTIQQQSQLRGAELERIQNIKDEGRRNLELKALSGAITPAEMESLGWLRQREQEEDSFNPQRHNMAGGFGLTSERVIGMAQAQQAALQSSNLLEPEKPAIDMQGIVQTLTSNLSINIAGAVGQSNNILGAIAGQIENIIGIIKDTSKPANTPTQPITVNNISTGPSPQQIQQISRQTTLKTVKGVFSLL
jgi:hypothetical protein